ncbi:MAG: ATP-dependent DNA helicase [Euryarchaeota archaeon]|nr:ATP-dependent DNA helicase [Euryarchaeota archaeon]
MVLFPYSHRPFQKDLVDTITSNIHSEGHLILESGTGTGKTVCALSGTIEAAIEHGKKILYLTRTNSQQQQVTLELREIGKQIPILGVGMQGRQSTCPLIQRDPELRSGTPEELSKLCAERKARSMQEKEGGCRFYDATISTPLQEVESYCRKHLPTVEEFSKYCDNKGLCPHELAKDLLLSADVVSAPYAYFFMPFIRNNLLDWMNISIEDLIVIVDEAHNLPDYAREVRSVSISSRLLELVSKEIDDHGDPEIFDGVSVMDLVNVLSEQLDAAMDEYIIEDDGLIPPSYLDEALMAAFTTTSSNLSIMARNMMDFGEYIRNAKKKEGRLPRSYMHSLGAHLLFWINMDEEHYVKLIVGGDNPAFEAYCLDPSIATRILLDCHATVHMSGTLIPLNEYRDSIGLPADSCMCIFPSPFPPENRKVFYLEDVTTKYEDIMSDECMISRIEDHVVSLCNVMERNTVVFFPSYQLMDRFIADGMLNRIRREVHLERKGMPQNELMAAVEMFKSSEEGAVLFAVMGGRISEGADFPDRELEMAILVGIPYPKPTARQRALLHYYELRFGCGWEYTVKAPVTRKLLQAVGRLIRNENDVGVAVIMDRRAAQFSTQLPSIPSEYPVNDALNFFKAMGR